SQVSREGTIRKACSEGKVMYLAGSSYADSGCLPTVTKIDTGGKVIWTAYDPDNYARFETNPRNGESTATCDNVFKSGSRLFAVARDADHITTELWAISDSGGTLIWK